MVDPLGVNDHVVALAPTENVCVAKLAGIWNVDLAEQLVGDTDARV